MHNFNIFRNETCDHLDQIPPIENGTLVTFVNNCLYAMIEQLNKFACYAESRMLTLNRQIDNCYTNLVILEMKLNSIDVPDEIAMVSDKTAADPKLPGTISTVMSDSIPETVGAQIELVEQPTQNAVDPLNNENKDANSSVHQIQPNEEGDQQDQQEEQEPVPDELDRFRKMLKFGVQIEAVRLKMKSEGYDPTLL
ncbi:hypothetical protein RDWZM_009343 [Blomia tropicalis]|uniref:Uncharacterized protein n=1 Tax=Blomia tropicalis TaxID=40697 RepID=A0A9Q0RM78_BLOTA|nr:WASH complex subunit [Blomia tropicalis]KAJ6218186.1 hypothetical protein RDWZM_009343 [Blomia tropicalis]